MGASPYAIGGLAAFNPLAALGFIGSGVLSWLGQEDTNDTNLQIAREATQASMGMANAQMGFQAHMSNTAYQRATADMKAAGINPMLAIQQGGASTPAGASGTASTATMGNSLGAALNSANDFATTVANINKTFSDATEADTRAALNRATMPKIAAEIRNLGATGKNLATENEILRASVQGAKNAEWRSKKVGKIQDGFNWIMEKMLNGGFSAVQEAYGPGGEKALKMQEKLLR